MNEQERVTALMRRQFGVVSRAQLLELGINDNAIRWRLESDAWLRADRGVYRNAAAPITWSQRASALSHHSAGWLWRLDGFKEPRTLDLCAPTQKRKRETGVVWHRAQLDPRQKTVRDSLSVTHLPRTLIDLAMILPPERLEIAVESALRRHSAMRRWTAEELERVGGSGFPNIKLLRALVGTRDPVRESALEVLVERLIRDSDLPPPVRQYELFVNRAFIARLDFAYPHLKVGIQAQGYAFHVPTTKMHRGRQSTHSA